MIVKCVKHTDSVLVYFMFNKFNFIHYLIVQQYDILMTQNENDITQGHCDRLNLMVYTANKLWVNSKKLHMNENDG